MPAISGPSGGSSSLPVSYLEYSNANGILAIVGTVTALALATVLLRIYVRAVALKVFGVDDWLMVVTMILSIMVLVCFVEETHHGIGKHFIVAISNQSEWRQFTIWNWAHALIIVLSNSTLKISVAFFLMRITGRTGYHRFLWGVIVFIVLFTIACLGTLIFQCLPVRAAWDLALQPPPLGHGTAKCFSASVFGDIGIFNSSIIIATDVLFASIPIPIIWSLQLNTRQKISLVCTFSVGFFSCIAGIVKTVLQANVFKNMDWTVHDSFEVWFAIEVNAGILAANPPALKPLLGWILEPVKRSHASGSKESSNSSRSSKMALPFRGRFAKDRRANSLGYMKQSSNKDTPMGTIDTTRSMQLGDIPGDKKDHFTISISHEELKPDDDIGNWIISDSRKNSELGITWLNEAAKEDDDTILTEEGGLLDARNRILKTTEVRLGREF